MNDVKKFKVLKDMRVHQHGTNIDINIPKDTLLELISFKLRADCNFEMYCCVEYNFYIIDLRTIIRTGYLEEIIPNKTQISTESDSILDYEKKYNMWDATHLMKNHDVQMIDSNFNHTWIYNPNYKTLFTEDKYGVEYFIEDLFNKNFGYIDSLDLTFTLVKPVEEVEEKWIRIKSRTELFNKIRECKRIRENKMIDENKAHSREFDTTKELKDDMWNIFGKFDNTNYFVEYLEEN